MIKVKVNKDIITISGHALYDEYGKDIVCASVSSIITTSINAILRLEDNSISYEEEQDKMIIKIIRETDITKKLILNMINLLKELEQTYPKNISVMEGY